MSLTIESIVANMNANDTICIKNEETGNGVETLAYNVRNCLHFVTRIKGNSRGHITLVVSAESFENIITMLCFK